MTKAICAPKVKRFSDIPNVGPATADDFERLGLRTPAELAHCDAYELYHRLCRITGARHDPCMMGVFLNAVAFMQGAPSRPWWHYTAERKEAAARGNLTPTVQT